MILAAIKKDLWLLLRDRGALISLFVLPIVFIVAFGAMFGTSGDGPAKRRPIAIWHAPGDTRGEAIAKAVEASPGFRAVVATSADDVRGRVSSEDVDAGLIIPAQGPVELSIDLGAPLQVRGPIEGAMHGLVMQAMSPFPAASLPPMLEAKTPPGIAKPLEHISSFQVTVPGNATLFGFFIALTVAMAFTVDRRTGTWRRLLAAPIPRSHALLATLVPYYLVGILQLAFLFGIGTAAFGMKIAGSISALVVLCLALTLCSVCLGFLFAAIAKSEKALGGVGSVVLLVMGLLGGCMFPRAFMPPFMKTLGLGVPHGWALDGFYTVLVREGSTIADIAPQLGALVGFAVVFAGLGLVLFRFER